MKSWLLLLTVIFLSGCVTVRSYTVEKPRIDTDVKGNRGFLSGSHTGETKKSNLSSTRKISVIEVEFGSKKNKKIKQSLDEGENFNDDLFMGSDVFAEVTDNSAIEEIDLNSFEGGTFQEYRQYVVQKNDTLQKISHKFYGTTKKWELIFKANKETLKSPDKIYPGKKIVIPPLG